MKKLLILIAFSCVGYVGCTEPIQRQGPQGHDVESDAGDDTVTFDERCDAGEVYRSGRCSSVNSDIIDEDGSEPQRDANGSTDPCAEDNGGCGDPSLVACTHGQDMEVLCEVLDPCECGDPEAFVCHELDGDDEPICEFVGQCHFEFIRPLIADAYVRSDEENANFGDQNELVLSKGSSTTPVKRMLMKFDLDDLDSPYPITEARLAALVYESHLHESMVHSSVRTPTVYFHQVANDWDEMEITWATRPAWIRDLGAWHEPSVSEGEAWAISQPPGPVDVFEEVISEGGPISVEFVASSYVTRYYSREAVEMEKRPYLKLTTSRCRTPLIQADQSGTVDSYYPDNNAHGFRIFEGQLKGYLRFDLRDIPEGVCITGAEVTLSVNSVHFEEDEGEVLVRYSEDDDWTWRTISWATRPAIEDEVLGSFRLSADDIDTPVTFNEPRLLRLVRRQHSDNGLMTLVFSTPSGGASFYKHDALDRTQQPVLHITYELEATP